MKKWKVMGLTLVTGLTLAACSDGDSDTAQSEAAANESTEQIVVEESAAAEEEVSDDKFEFNQEITDNENFKATLISIEHVVNELFDEEKYVVTFDVENKREDTIAFQAREVSINGRMVDESLLNMSTDVSAGKSASATLEIQDYSGGELPSLEGDFEMLLHVFDWDTMEYEQDEPVSVTFN